MKNLTRITFLLGTIFSFFNLHAQETYGIKGTLTDTENKPVESGNVIVLNPLDSTVIKGTHFWEGKFELFGIEPRNVLIRFTSDGLKDVYISKIVDANSELFDLGEIKLEEAIQELEGVVILHRKPMYTREVGKLIVNVEGTILSERGTILELLKSAPNVIVRSDGGVSVAGKGSAIVFLDGQRVISMEMLSAMSSDLVSKIEIIENPSSRYDAEGNAVIEIITKSGALNGYQGNIGLRGMKRTESQVAYWGNLQYRKDWFSMYASIGQYSGALHEVETYYRDIYGANPVQMENDVDKRYNHKFDSWGYLDFDFRLDSLNTLFINYAATRLKSEVDIDNVNLIYDGDNFLGDLNSESNGFQQRWMHSVSGGYIRTLDTLESEISITGQYTNFNIDANNNIEQVSDFGTPVRSMFRNDNFNAIRVYSGNVDYVKNWSDKVKLNMGAKNSYVTNESGINFEYEAGDVWYPDTDLNNQFDFYENILAGYAELSGRLNKFSYNTGLRYEWTTTKGNSLIAGTGIVNRDYQNLFPNVQVNYDITKDLIIGASYNNRINRPSYQDLDPFINYIDSVSAFRGNPQLIPAVSHNAELSLVYMEYASITLGYAKTKNPMYLTVEQNIGENTFNAIVKNIESSETMSLGLVLPYEIPWWTTFNAFGYQLNRFEYNDNAALVVNNRPTFYMSLYNEFRIKKWFDLELTYDYVSPGSDGIFLVKPYQSLGASIARKFLDDKLSVRFSVFDALFQEAERAESTLTGFFVGYTSRSDSRSFMLTAIWNFGKMKDSNMKGKMIDKEERNRVKQ